MSKYAKEHIEDVAKLLRDRVTLSHVFGDGSAWAEINTIAHHFVSLFAADNLPTCIDCGASRAEPGPHGDECAGHLFEGGFDRDQFLTACGLEREE